MWQFDRQIQFFLQQLEKGRSLDLGLQEGLKIKLGD